jgi:hypothetical protein
MTEEIVSLGVARRCSRVALSGLVDEAVDVFMSKHDTPTNFVVHESSLIYQSPDEAHGHAKVCSSIAVCHF